MGCPDCQNCLLSADACPSRVSTGSEPVVLRSSSSPAPDAGVGNSVNSLPKDLVQEENIVGDNAGSEVVAEVIAALDDCVNVLVRIGHDELERPEEFATTKIKVLNELLEADLNSGGFVGAVDFRDVMWHCEGFTTEEKLGSRNLHDAVNVILNSLVIPAENGSDSQVVQSASLGQGGDLFNKALLYPILVGKHNRLSRTLLTSSSVGVLIRHPRHVVDLGNIRTQDLPIETSILQSDFALGLFCQMFCHFCTSSKLDDFEVCLVNDVLHFLVGAVEEVDLVQGESARGCKVQELFHHYRDPSVTFEKRSVSGQKSSINLKARNFDGEIEGTDDAHVAKGPPVTSRSLAVVVPSHIE